MTPRRTKELTGRFSSAVYRLAIGSQSFFLSIPSNWLASSRNAVNP
jgi:hypothetical protein